MEELEKVSGQELIEQYRWDIPLWRVQEVLRRAVELKKKENRSPEEEKELIYLTGQRDALSEAVKHIQLSRLKELEKKEVSLSQEEREELDILRKPPKIIANEDPLGEYPDNTRPLTGEVVSELKERYQ